MQRELQSGLFKDDQMRTPSSHSQNLSPSIPAKTSSSPSSMIFENDRKSRALNDSFEALFRRMETFETRFDQITKNIALRVERTMTMISHVQTQINHVSNDVNEKIVQLSAKINERRLSESRTEDLIERHNTVVRTLEARLQQMHRMVTEQQAQIHSFASALNEARAELRHVKRND